MIAIILAIEMKTSLLGESATEEAEERIRTAVGSHPQVRRVIHLRSQHIGPDELIVGIKVEFDPSLTMSQLAEAIDSVEEAVRAAEPTAATIYIEPDIARAGTQ